MSTEENQIKYSPKDEKTFVERYGGLFFAGIALTGSLFGIYMGINQQISTINEKVNLYNRDLTYISNRVDNIFEVTTNSNKRLDDFEKLSNERYFECRTDVISLKGEVKQLDRDVSRITRSK